MKKRGKPFFFITIALAAAYLLSGCGVLLSSSRIEEPAPAALELRLGSVLPEDVVLTWDPAAIAVDRAEVSVSGGASDSSRTVTVTIQLCPIRP
ncbi:MAG: hypothetical protein HDT14_04660 [Oscillibacter sp.]|nr:hypothetical protein [Oscillibacter sp.]